MPNIAHFAIPADDVQRALRFYQSVFGWQFNAWGPPDFHQIQTGSDENPGIPGALEKRDGPRVQGGQNAFICTISVDSIDEAATLIEEHGGTITYPRFTIEHVGTLIQFRDTEGNTVSAMQYEPGHP